MDWRELLRIFWTFAPGPNDISKARAIEIATKIYQEREIPIIQVGIAWRKRGMFIMTANANPKGKGGGWYIPIDRRTGQAHEPFLIPR